LLKINLSLNSYRSSVCETPTRDLNHTTRDLSYCCLCSSLLRHGLTFLERSIEQRMVDIHRRCGAMIEEFGSL
jgi:hypothetical protein